MRSAAKHLPGTGPGFVSLPLCRATQPRALGAEPSVVPLLPGKCLGHPCRPGEATEGLSGVTVGKHAFHLLTLGRVMKYGAFLLPAGKPFQARQLNSQNLFPPGEPRAHRN